MDQIPKDIKQALRNLVRRAYEIELGRALASLQAQFGQWTAGEISAFDLSEEIHRFHQGPARELYVRYSEAPATLAVAHAIETGILDRTQVAPDVLAHLARALSFYESQRRQ